MGRENRDQSHKFSLYQQSIIRIAPPSVWTALTTFFNVIFRAESEAVQILMFGNCYWVPTL